MLQHQGLMGSKLFWFYWFVFDANNVDERHKHRWQDKKNDKEGSKPLYLGRSLLRSNFPFIFNFILLENLVFLHQSWQWPERWDRRWQVFQKINFVLPQPHFNDVWVYLFGLPWFWLLMNLIHLVALK